MLETAAERSRPREGVRGRLAAGLLCVGLVVLGLVLPGPLPTTRAQAATPVRAAGHVRIMAVGDSITHGYAGDASWRYFVDRELRRQGVAHEFVGPYVGPTPRT